MSAPHSTRSLILANGGLLVMVTIAGAFFPILERMLLSWDVLSVTAARQLVGGIGLWVALAFYERRLPRARARLWPRLFLVGGLGIALSSVLTSVAVYYSDGVSAAIVSAANPITAALLARLLYRLPLARAVLIGAVLAVAGGLLAILASGKSLGSLRGGEVLMVAAGAIWTWYSVAAQRLLAGHSQLAIAALTTLPAGLVVLALVGLVGATGLMELRVDLSPASLLLLAYAGLLSIGLGNVLWHYGVSRVGVAVSTMYTNLMPVAAVLAALWFGQSLRAAQLVGGAIILGGVVYAQLASRRDHAHAANRLGVAPVAAEGQPSSVSRREALRQG